MTESGARTSSGSVPKEGNSGSDNNSNPGRSAPVDSGAGVDELAQRLREAENVDQDLATIVADNWQKVLGALVCMLLVIWVVEEYKSAQSKKLGDAADKFAIIQESFKNVSASSEAEDKQSVSTAIEQNVKALGATSDTPFYSQTAPLYKAKVAFEAGDFEAAKNILKTFKIESMKSGSFSSNDKDINADRLSTELATLLMSRVLISESKIKEAREYLIGLSKAGSITSIEALVALYRISGTAQERAEAVAAAREVRTAKPQYGETLVREFGTLGVSLD